MCLLLLATEVLIEILLYLDVPDAYAIHSVNRFFNNIYKVSLELQYALECKVAHVRDNLNCHLPIGDRLRMLRDREAAWSDISPDIQKDHNLLMDSSSTIHSLFRDDSFHRPSLDLDDLRHISCCIEEHDLIACLTCPYISRVEIEVQIKLIQQSTGAAHPLAKTPTIILGAALAAFTRAEDCTIEVFGENLALTIHLDSHESLYVFNWMTGISKCEPFCLLYATGIIVLDENLILVPDFETWSLRVYHIPPSSTGGTVKLICQLCLPALYYPISHTMFSWVKCRSAPNPTLNDKFPKHIPSSVPFINDAKTALIQVIWDLWHYEILGPENGYISLVTHRHSIIDTLPPSNEWSTMTTPAVIDWEMWGPSVTHWSSLPRSDFHGFDNVVNGQRVILPVSVYPSGMVLLKDFNKYRARRVRKKQVYNDFEHVMLQPDPIENTLPFCETYVAI